MAKIGDRAQVHRSMTALEILNDIPNQLLRDIRVQEELRRNEQALYRGVSIDTTAVRVREPKLLE